MAFISVVTNEGLHTLDAGVINGIIAVAECSKKGDKAVEEGPFVFLIV